MAHIHHLDGLRATLMVTADHRECLVCRSGPCDRIMLPDTFAGTCPWGADVRSYAAGRVLRLETSEVHVHDALLPHLHVPAEELEEPMQAAAEVTQCDACRLLAAVCGLLAWVCLSIVVCGLAYGTLGGRRRAPPPRARRRKERVLSRAPRHDPPTTDCDCVDYGAIVREESRTPSVESGPDKGGPWTQVWSRRHASWC
jgi:hypothetical protein